MSNERERLRSLLLEHSLMFGDFTLTSGKKSRYYFDSKKTTLLAEGAYLTAREVLRTLRDQGVRAQAIAGCPPACGIAADGPGQTRPGWKRDTDCPNFCSSTDPR